MMITCIFLILVTLLSKEILQVYGQNITYSVIFPSIKTENNIGVILNNNSSPYILSASEKSPYLLTVNAPISTIGYQYAILSGDNIVEKESFSRSPVQKDTPNEFYNRSFNTFPIPSFSQLYPSLKSIHRINTAIHQDDQIPSFFFDGDEAEVANMHSHIFDKNIKVELDLTYIGLHQVISYSKVKMKVSGRGTRYTYKSSYQINLGRQSNLFGYQKIKLRSLVTDPSYLREKTTFDLAQSLGLASTGFSFARVFINSKPYGLFGILEDFENPWLANEFNNGNQNNYTQSVLYAGSIDAPLTYLGNNETLYSAQGNNFFNESMYEIKEGPFEGQVKLPGSFERLIAFTKFLIDPPTTESDAVYAWNKQIDADSVIRSLALEIIVGNSDGYISGPYNYYLYSDSSQNNRLIYIPNDMDITFGSASIYNVMDTIQGKYENFPGFNATRPLLQAMLKVPEFKSKFEGLIENVIGQQILHQEFLYNRIDALSNMLKEDVDWDKSIPRNYVILPALTLSSKFPPTQDMSFQRAVFVDYFERIKHNNITFEEAVNGTINRPSIMGLKEWISKSTNSYLQANPSIVAKFQPQVSNLASSASNVMTLFCITAALINSLYILY